MKNTTMWTLCLRSVFARSTGRMSSIDAPVVPMNEAMTVPNARNVALDRGVHLRSPAR